MCGTVPPIPQYIFMVCYLVKHRDFVSVSYTDFGNPDVTSQTMN